LSIDGFLYEEKTRKKQWKNGKKPCHPDSGLLATSRILPDLSAATYAKDRTYHCLCLS
jgi:hypothetical protein